MWSWLKNLPDAVLLACAITLAVCFILLVSHHIAWSDGYENGLKEHALRMDAIATMEHHTGYD